MKSWTRTILATLTTVLLASPAGFGAYSQISQNLIGPGGTANSDTIYTGDQAVKKLSIHDAGFYYTLYDWPAGAPSGTKGLGTTSIETYFRQADYDGNPLTNDALFTDGFFSFSFDFTPTGGTLGHYTISGPIRALLLQVTQTGPISKLTGEAWWTATTVNLPGSNVWPAAGYSSIRSFTIDVKANLSGFDWATMGTSGEALYNIYPDSPEPATVLLLAAGAFGATRRRRARS